MPKNFSVAIDLYTSGKGETISTNTTCRDALVNLVYYRLATLPPDNSIVRSECSIYFDLNREAQLAPFCQELKARWYPNLEFEFSQEQASIFRQTARLKLTDSGLLALGALWWMILIERLLDQKSAQNASSIEELLNLSKRSYRDSNWFNYEDRENHINLLPHFDKVKDPILWWKVYCKRHLFGEQGCWGPVSALAFLPRVEGKL